MADHEGSAAPARRAAEPPDPQVVARLLFLQRTAGNVGVVRVLTGNGTAGPAPGAVPGSVDTA
ncbi:hypothetical protein ACIQWR_38240 [Streptomyces sp. NPDC098789]|uniref:hypothetical protein n=1 Tax=Streptomyces sp. NPDC098789 TaxID=3366098 RepID=UPI0037FD683A